MDFVASFFCLIKVFFLSCKAVLCSGKFFPCCGLLRKSFLHLWGCGNHLQGIGGPGAPHAFAMDRRADLGQFGSICIAVCSNWKCKTMWLTRDSY